MRKKSFWFILTIILLGGLIGSALGELLAYVLPDGVVRQALTKAASANIGPGTFNIIILSITLGFSIHINIVGVLGIIIAAYMLRWIE